MKLSNIHLLAIVLLSVFVGSWSILGIKEAYENLEKPRHVHEDYMCSVVPKKVPRDVQMKHYAEVNSIEAAKKQHFNDCKTAECRNKRAQLAATAANSPPKMTITPEELSCMEKLADTPRKKELYDNEVKMMKFLLGPESGASAAEKIDYVKRMRTSFSKHGCHPPKGGEVASKAGSNYAPTDPNYKCLRLNSLQHNSMNEERVGMNSLERRRRLPCNQIPSGTEDDYILKTKIVPPVCPKCPECPSLEFLYKQLQKKKKEEDKEEIEDDLDKNKIEGSSNAAMRREKRRRTSGEANPPANRNGKRPNETAFAAQSAQPIARLNSFAAFR